jgi:hypothetical protein
MTDDVLKTDEKIAPIIGDAIYPLPLFMKHTGLAKSAIRMMRRSGLIVRRVGRRSYIRGRDFCSWFDDHAEQVS